MLYSFLRPFLFALDAETAHGLALLGLELTSPFLPDFRPSPLPVRAMGIDFPNPVGLAAGLDKNGEHVDGLSRFGFGFLEVGTVTPRPQPGNPKPRMFRLVESRAVINRMGFNNEGVDRLVENVSRARYRGVLGINIGKNFDTPIERAADDYLACLRKVYPLATYVAANISSPNTKQLRELQGAAELDGLLAALKGEQQRLADRHGRYVPLAVKIAPDLEDSQVQAIAGLLAKHGIDGAIATNTTVSREGVEGEAHGAETGGLSGEPLRETSTAVVRKLSRALDGALPVIGVGGILSGADAVEKVEAGAALVQLYTGLIYRGPELACECVEALAARARAK